jgi:hypothetical protein
MRTMFMAGSIVRAGFYLNRDHLDLIAVGGEGGTLPGDAGQRYCRVPALAALLLAPLLGGLFVVLMPCLRLILMFRRAGRVAWPPRAGRLLAAVLPSRRQRNAAAVPGSPEGQAKSDGNGKS